MFYTSFGHGILRKYVIYFGTVFNNIHINRYDDDGNLIQTSKVPINYGPREKFLARLQGNPELNRPIAIQLPRITYEITSIYYDPTRKLNALNKTIAPVPGNPSQLQYQYQPVPYNIDITMSIMVKNVEDGTYIVEQILPNFNPVWTGTLIVNPDLNQKHDIPITLDNVAVEDSYEGDFQTRRAVIWTLNFTIKGYFFGPTIQDSGSIIKEIDVNLRVPSVGVSLASSNNTTNSNTGVNIDITPGQYANGNPATYTTSSQLFTFNIENSTGVFRPTEKVFVDGDNYMYVTSANSTTITARHINGVIANNTFITGLENGFTANITSISVSPENSVNSLSIDIESNYGFIYDIKEF